MSTSSYTPAELFPGSERYRLLTRRPGLARLREAPGGHTVWIWTDDPSDFAFGGNKVRFYEYLIPEILKEKPDVLLSCGSLWSNHIRVSAAVASLLGLECHLLITADDPGENFFKRNPDSNVALARSLGATLRFGGSFAALLKLGEYEKELKESGKKVYTVPNAGHTPYAVRAYASVITEALMAMDGYSARPTRVFLPVASGTTLSGVLTGCEILKGMGVDVPEVTAFAVGNVPRRAQAGVRSLIGEAATVIGGMPAFSPLPDVRDCGKNDYGKPDAELLALRESVQKTDGITLDPTYNINAFYGMIKYLEEHRGIEDALYICTGGNTTTVNF